MSEIESALRDAGLFSGVDARTVARVARQGTLRSYAPGEVIIRQGDAASAFYLILKGRVAVAQEANGQVNQLGTQEPGSFFGEMALIEDHPRTASVTAIEPTECFLMVAWEFTALMHEHPSVTEALLRELITRIHRREQQVF
jgi:CRP/FNR family transcriptional regulator, cyclic AMP receptor protein